MKTIIIVAVVVILLFVGRKGYAMYRQSQDADYLDYDHVKSKFPGLTVERLSNILLGFDQNPIQLDTLYHIKNPTPSRFKLDDVKLKVLTPESQRVIAKPYDTQEKSIAKIEPHTEDNSLHLQFKIYPSELKTLIRENGGLPAIAENRLSSPDWGISFILKGFIEVYGFNIEINEKITI